MNLRVGDVEIEVPVQARSVLNPREATKVCVRVYSDTDGSVAEEETLSLDEAAQLFRAVLEAVDAA
jgi:hypothetical protein